MGLVCNCGVVVAALIVVSGCSDGNDEDIGPNIDPDGFLQVAVIILLFSCIK